MGSYDGTNDICPAPDVDTTSTFHSSLFWVHCPNSVFQPRRQFFPPYKTYYLNLLIKNPIAWKYYPDPNLVANTASMFGMVFGQLFSHGQFWIKASDELWRSASCCLVSQFLPFKCEIAPCLRARLLRPLNI
jgi:hypothetical protein